MPRLQGLLRIPVRKRARFGCSKRIARRWAVIAQGPAGRPGTIVTRSPCRARSTMAPGGAFAMLATALGWHGRRLLRAKERRLFAGGRRFHWAEPLFGGPSAGTGADVSAQGRRHRLAPPDAGGPGLGMGGCRARICGVPGPSPGTGPPGALTSIRDDGATPGAPAQPNLMISHPNCDIICT